MVTQIIGTSTPEQTHFSPKKTSAAFRSWANPEKGPLSSGTGPDRSGQLFGPEL